MLRWNLQIMISILKFRACTYKNCHSLWISILANEATLIRITRNEEINSKKYSQWLNSPNIILYCRKYMFVFRVIFECNWIILRKWSKAIIWNRSNRILHPAENIKWSFSWNTAIVVLLSYRGFSFLWWNYSTSVILRSFVVVVLVVFFLLQNLTDLTEYMYQWLNRSDKKTKKKQKKKKKQTKEYMYQWLNRSDKKKKQKKKKKKTGSNK